MQEIPKMFLQSEYVRVELSPYGSSNYLRPADSCTGRRQGCARPRRAVLVTRWARGTPWATQISSGEHSLHMHTHPGKPNPGPLARNRVSVWTPSCVSMAVTFGDSVLLRNEVKLPHDSIMRDMTDSGADNSAEPIWLFHLFRIIMLTGHRPSPSRPLITQSMGAYIQSLMWYASF